jgi:hypothetical protein
LAAWCHVYHLTFSHLPPPSRISLWRAYCLLLDDGMKLIILDWW